MVLSNFAGFSTPQDTFEQLNNLHWARLQVAVSEAQHNPTIVGGLIVFCAVFRVAVNGSVPRLSIPIHPFNFNGNLVFWPRKVKSPLATWVKLKLRLRQWVHFQILEEIVKAVF